jgi:hypothetical protein
MLNEQQQTRDDGGDDREGGDSRSTGNESANGIRQAFGHY